MRPCACLGALLLVGCTALLGPSERAVFEILSAEVQVGVQRGAVYTFVTRVTPREASFVEVCHGTVFVGIQVESTSGVWERGTGTFCQELFTGWARVSLQGRVDTVEIAASLRPDVTPRWRPEWAGRRMRLTTTLVQADPDSGEPLRVDFRDHRLRSEPFRIVVR